MEYSFEWRIKQGSTLTNSTIKTSVSVFVNVTVCFNTRASASCFNVDANMIVRMRCACLRVSVCSCSIIYVHDEQLEPSPASSYPSQRKHWKEMMRNFMFDDRSDSERLKRADEATGESNYYGDDDNNDDAGFDDAGRKKRAGSGKKDGGDYALLKKDHRKCFFSPVSCYKCGCLSAKGPT
ncbi:hypothetical protein HELRODRAFT_159385 [Helobdella robusta]|uniref:Uncharacterized protein n=1 Tax=Helobdella robusta TaxID=6412 RepID=T1ENZ5_HELRO|nr:hypothetical protein HELRODRAFT_159385 [Helobdella robusta]ESO12801.1 hypothetical protein HELRODRAFT_159385 [Helobdella robusta]